MGRLLSRFILYLVCIFFVICCLPIVDSCYAEIVSSQELINNAKQYDGKTIIYAGEVIGDIMVRGRFAWINLHDKKKAIGVWIDKDKIANIVYTGGYKTIGDWVEITGVFNRACLEHGGDLDIHALGIRKISEGQRLADEINPHKKNSVFLLLGGLCLALILRLLKRK